MTPSEANQWAEQLAQVTASDLPLAEGLRAAALESSRPRIAASFQSLADTIQRGASFDQALQQNSHLLPAHLRGLLAAAARTNRLGPALMDLVQHQRTRRAVRGRIQERLAYPIIVGLASTVLLLGLMFGVIPQFERLILDFQLQLPFTTKFLFWWRDFGIWMVLLIVVLTGASAIGFRLVEGAAASQRFFGTVPFVGPMYKWLGLSEWLRLMSLLVKHEIPLAESLQLAAAGAGKAYIHDFSQRLADRVARGEPLTSALTDQSETPVSLVPLIAWGDKSQRLAEAFALAADMLEDRVDRRSLLLQSILPSVVFITIGCAVLLVAGGIFVPLHGLLHGLT